MNRQDSLQQEASRVKAALFSLLLPALALADSASLQTSAGTAAATGQDGKATQASPDTSRLHQDETHWRLRFNLSLVDPMGSSVSTTAWRHDTRIDLGAGVGAGFQAEYRISPRLGIEAGILGAAEFDISQRISGGGVRGDIGLTGFAPLSLGLNVHLTPKSSVDLYAGPQFALVKYGTERAWWDWPSSGVRVSIDDDWAWGLVAGLDVPLGKRGWLFNANLRYLETNLSQSLGDAHFDGEFDPLVFSAGFGYAF